MLIDRKKLTALVWTLLALGIWSVAAMLWVFQSALEARIVAGESIKDMSFSPDGTRLATANNKEAAFLWNLERSELPTVLSFRRFIPEAVRFSADGTRMVSSARSTTSGPHQPVRIDVWKTGTRTPEQTIEIPGGVIDEVAFADSSTVVGVLKDRLVMVDLQSNQVVDQLPLPNQIMTRLGRTPSGDFLVYGGSDRRASVWDSSKRAVIFDQPDTMVSIRDIDLSTDGRYLAACGRAPGDVGRLSVWNLADGKELGVPPGVPVLGCVRIVPDGSAVVASHGQGRFIIWRFNAGYLTFDQELAADGRVERMAFAPDGRRLAIATSTSLSIWEFPSGKQLQVLVDPLKLYSLRRIVRWGKISLFLLGTAILGWTFRHRLRIGT
ncbi:MAG TPA: WD40 repeat domain-containing protein [Pirellulales bacterium]|nr:WD40 repeat domain-containing protein [Pirellulales bacterium]